MQPQPAPARAGLPLVELNCSDNPGLTTLAGVGTCAALRELHAARCGALASLGDLTQLTQLETLDVSGCGALRTLAGLPAPAAELTELFASDTALPATELPRLARARPDDAPDVVGGVSTPHARLRGRQVAACPALGVLHVRGCPLTADGCAAAARLAGTLAPLATTLHELHVGFAAGGDRTGERVEESSAALVSALPQLQARATAWRRWRLVIADARSFPPHPHPTPQVLDGRRVREPAQMGADTRAGPPSAALMPDWPTTAGSTGDADEDDTRAEGEGGARLSSSSLEAGAHAPAAAVGGRGAGADRGDAMMERLLREEHDYLQQLEAQRCVSHSVTAIVRHSCRRSDAAPPVPRATAAAPLSSPSCRGCGQRTATATERQSQPCGRRRLAAASRRASPRRWPRCGRPF